MSITEEDRKLAKAACIGACAALVLAMFTPAAVLIVAGLLTVGGIVAYKRCNSTGDNKGGKPCDGTGGNGATGANTTEGK